MGKDKSTSKVSKTSRSGHKRKQDDKTLTSASALRCLCPCGKGGFGAVYIVSIDGVSQPCVLKKLVRVGDKNVLKACRKEFKVQVKLFMNPKCFNRIPRPIYILDLLDEDYKGVYGFCMEFCIGGSVKDFSRSWCVGGKYGRGCSSSSEFKVQVKLFMNPKCFNRIPRPIYILDLLDEDYKGVYGFCMEFCIGGSVKDFSRSWCVGGKYGRGCSSSSVESEDSSSDSDSDSDSSSDSSSDSDSDSSSTRIDPMTLDPLRVHSKPDLIHRDIKPDNFLVRVDPKDGESTIVLSDLGMVQILDSISSSTFSKSAIQGEGKEKTKQKNSRCGTLVFNSYETLLDGTQTQKSDGYSLGMSILALFLCEPPFTSLPIFREVFRKVRLEEADEFDIMKLLKRLMENDMCPRLSQSHLFKSLLTIEDRKYELVHKVLNEVFIGLTKLNEDERMSVHEACEKVQSIKPLLPKIGEGWECPSIDDIVKAQVAKHKGDSGCIVEEDASIQSVVLKPNWDDGLSLSRPSESKTTSASSSTSSSASKEEKEEKGKEEEDLRKEIDRQAKEVEALKQKLKLEEEKRKREELKTARLMRKVDHRVIFDLVDKIKKSPDSESTSKLYHEHRDEILSVFLAFQSKSEIEEHKREIVICVQCLRWFVRHFISGNKIYLPIPDLNDLIDTFIGHLSRCEEVLDGDVYGEYCSICTGYTFKVKHIKDSFLPKISPTFQRILERGSKEKLGGGVALNLLKTIKNISNSPSSSTRSSILTLIKPYILDWLRIYNDSKCYGRWMLILSTITLSSDNSTPNKSMCSEAWPLFHPVLDVVKREFVGDKIVGDNHERVLCFFSHLCCDPAHAVEVYDNVKDLLDMWFTVMKKEGHKRGIKYWSRLISMFSTVPSLVPHISTKYDTSMVWCKNNGAFDGDYSRYLDNCKILKKL
ncbi:hypothetical protein ADUPG1_014168 [Aduncisulcus paluster]|uniref:Protein kinase domain-containing protein n=1 Tax=Aduncisulcus paluster TaxID=2918883 RepID=A0ABQ5KEQ4_9EUKA|nr:hypothetical protein ADUPG1_014168 [Aduncisulcus paluster]